MPGHVHARGDFISYPTNRVVGTIAAAKDAQAAIEALLHAGFDRPDIDILQGEQDLHRLDPTGAEHGFLAQFQRTLIRTAGPVEEYEHLRHHVDDVRAGRFVIMVLAKERQRRDEAATILTAHGAEYIGFYGRWAYQALDAAGAGADVTPLRPEHTAMRYDFLIETYETERIKVLSVWSEFRDEDLPVRPKPDDPRGRSVHEQMVHQCVSEDTWFRTMLGIDVGAPPLPRVETRIEFIKRYSEDSARRLDALRRTDERWWEAMTTFFDVQRSKAWVMTRRLTHTSHHRGQQMAMLRMLGRDLHSNYGPTADTGGLMLDHAPTIYAYPSVQALLEGESRGGSKSPLPGADGRAVTERPSQPR